MTLREQAEALLERFSLQEQIELTQEFDRLAFIGGRTVRSAPVLLVSLLKRLDHLPPRVIIDSIRAVADEADDNVPLGARLEMVLDRCRDA